MHQMKQVTQACDAVTYVGLTSCSEVNIDRSCHPQLDVWQQDLRLTSHFDFYDVTLA